ncbi:methyltransferase domain-containing protein [Eleftheria terrae]|uniref:methyltransferase domain-containing protein n=1 Tax=Eleftheria terrae TaxID=1597781 RepID=UPI00263B7048|nr:methyltransferase domain-containing protein [Eleftheria terrae]WKB50717.1 methyltransferase domain-containing protein [Eleftheria terrae]
MNTLPREERWIYDNSAFRLLKTTPNRNDAMPTLDALLDDFRRANSRWIDSWLFQQKPEILDLYPGSEAAEKVVRDLERLATAFPLGEQLAEHFAARLAPLPGATRTTRILEICAGSGWLSRRLAARLERSGCDFEITVSDLCAPRCDVHRIVSCAADATDLPFEDRSFDLLICAQSLHHFAPSALTQVLKEATRVAKVVSIFDIRRTIQGLLFLAAISPFYSREFISDGFTSYRRAYSPEEMRFLISELALPLQVKRFLPIGMLIET